MCIDRTCDNGFYSDFLKKKKHSYLYKEKDSR